MNKQTLCKMAAMPYVAASAVMSTDRWAASPAQGVGKLIDSACVDRLTSP